MNINYNQYFTYDSMGNPTRYKTSSPTASQNMQWTRSRLLASGSQKGNNFSYEYDISGLRYQKTVNGVKTNYYTVGGDIIAEKRGSAFIYYLYDMTGIRGMVYNGQYYIYEKNVFGDIEKIFDSTGTEVANYTYDAWGNIVSKSGTMADVNPFRYRGYYQDSETGFYYLQTRYYDPEIKRFINADNYELLPQLSGALGQLNLYSYCKNNPVMYTDPEGEFILFTILLVSGAVIGGVVGGVISYNNGSRGWDLVGGIALGASLGLAVSGLVISSAAAIYGGIYGIESLFLGLAAKQAFAFGALAFNSFAYIVGPLMGLSVQGIEAENNPTTVPKPGQTPRHPGTRK